MPSCGNSLILVCHLLLQMCDAHDFNDARVILQEEVTLRHGITNECTKDYEVRRVIFDSLFGGFSIAARQQQGGRCRVGDSWRYLDGDSRPVCMSLPQLTARFSDCVAGVLLVAKTAPAFPQGPLSQPTRPLPPRRCASLSCINLELQRFCGMGILFLW